MSGLVRIALRSLLGVLFWASSLAAQELGALARFESGELRDRWGGASVALDLSQPVPWRVFTLSGPNRLVLDFREVDWGRADAAAMLDGERFAGLRLGNYRPGWSRLVVEMTEPMVVDTAEMSIDTQTGRARVYVALDAVAQDEMDRHSGAPHDPEWDHGNAAELAPAPTDDNGRMIVVLDPGHGGIDPGAENGGTREADLMLTFARELSEVLRRTGEFDVVLTRNGDHFLSLESRVEAARDAGAGLFISLHADALRAGQARGAAVYTLSEEASDAASAALAERHDRDDLLAGVDLSGTDDRVANVLLDLARLENTPRSEALAGHLVSGIRNAVGSVHKRPQRSAGFSVLKAADIPSVLIELGFLSTETDLKNLTDPIWRQGMAAGIRDGIRAWALEDAALKRLRRK